VVEHLPSMLEALESIPNMTANKQMNKPTNQTTFFPSWAWCPSWVIPAPGRLTLEDHEFEDNLAYISRS
jgi:hypothetical protein